MTTSNEKGTLSYSPDQMGEIVLPLRNTVCGQSFDLDPKVGGNNEQSLSVLRKERTSVIPPCVRGDGYNRLLITGCAYVLLRLRIRDTDTELVVAIHRNSEKIVFYYQAFFYISQNLHAPP